MIERSRLLAHIYDTRGEISATAGTLVDDLIAAVRAEQDDALALVRREVEAAHRRIDAQDDEIARLRALVEECANEIECYARDAHGWPAVHPADQHKFNRDMDIVLRARAALRGEEGA